MLRALDCRRIQSWSLQYLTGDLEPENRRIQFEEHLRACEECQIKVADTRQRLQALLATDLPPLDVRKAIAELQDKPIYTAGRPMGWVLAGVLLLALFGSAYVWRLANPADFLGPRAGTDAAGLLGRESTTPSPVKPPREGDAPSALSKANGSLPPKKTVVAPPVVRKRVKPAQLQERPIGQARRSNKAVTRPSVKPELTPKKNSVEVIDRATGRVVGRAG